DPHARWICQRLEDISQYPLTHTSKTIELLGRESRPFRTHLELASIHFRWNQIEVRRESLGLPYEAHFELHDCKETSYARQASTGNASPLDAGDKLDPRQFESSDAPDRIVNSIGAERRPAAKKIPATPCRSLSAPASVLTRSSCPSAQAGWERYIGRGTRSWIGTSRSRSSRSPSPPIRTRSHGSSVKRSRWQRFLIKTSLRFATSATRTASRMPSWSFWKERPCAKSSTRV